MNNFVLTMLEVTRLPRQIEEFLIDLEFNITLLRKSSKAKQHQCLCT